MRHFFSVYKSLENKETVIDEVKSRSDAERVIQNSINTYIELYCR